MPDDTDRSATGPEASERAKALIESGITAAQDGDLEAALSALGEAERIAEGAGAVSLVATARINKGYAHWVSGDVEAARWFFADAAQLAREAQDTPRLVSALMNLGTAARKAGNPQEAASAFEEYLPLVGDDPAASAQAHIDCGLCFLDLAQYEAAGAHIAEGERVAQEAGLADLVVAARIDRGLVTERRGDLAAAREQYAQAASMAREAGLHELLAMALTNVAQAHRKLDELTEADEIFSEVEDLYRSLGKQTELADVLYWHALALKASGMLDRALATWREEEAIRRRLGQFDDLGDCLFEQALVLHDREDNDALEVVYPRAEDAYRRGGNVRNLAEVLVLHGGMLRAQDRVDEALSLAEEACAAGAQSGEFETECRARGFRAMVYADLGKTSEAREDLVAVELMSEDFGYPEQTLLVLARRAYVYAREGAPSDEVVGQLRAAFQHAAEYGQTTAGANAVRLVIADIRRRCGDAYAEALDGLAKEVAAAS